jgi:5-methylcytosine-specific restriction endonuclease McrA
MSDKCTVCSTSVGIKDKNVIPKSLLKNADEIFLLKEDVVYMCCKCYNSYSCKSDKVMQTMCKTNGFTYMSDSKIDKEVCRISSAARILIHKHDFVTKETSEACEKLIGKFLDKTKPFSRKDLNRLKDLRNNGNNPKFHVGAFLRKKLGTSRLFDIFRSNFHSFKSSYIQRTSYVKKVRIRKEKYDISSVFDRVKKWHEEDGGSQKLKWIKMDGDPIDISSYRYDMFYHKGVKCVGCGIEGEYFLKEKMSVRPYHLNLYAINDEGKEILMTVDHIYPRSKGGKDELDNFQPMCSPCNCKKADKII